jgi:hypothetical protein
MAAKLGAGREYGIWWFNTKRTTRSYVSKVGANGKEYAEQQRLKAKPKDEWIAVPVPLDNDYNMARSLVDGAREAMKSHARNYRRSSRAWELAGGVLFCAECGLRNVLRQHQAEERQAHPLLSLSSTQEKRPQGGLCERPPLPRRRARGTGVAFRPQPSH